MPTAAANDPLQIDYGDDSHLRHDVNAAILEVVKRVVTGCKNRDDDLYLLRQQNEGVSNPGVQGPWPNSCILEHTITREIHTSTHSNLMAAYRQMPYATLEALNPLDDDKVQRVETVVNDEMQLFGFTDALSRFAYTALEKSRGCHEGGLPAVPHGQARCAAGV